MGSKEKIDGELYIPYLEEIVSPGQLSAFQNYEAQREDVWSEQISKVHFPKAPTYSVLDNFSLASPFFEVAGGFYFDEGIESYINVQPRMDGVVLTPQDIDVSGACYWSITESLSYNTYNKLFIKGKKVSEGTLPEFLDVSKINSVAPDSTRLVQSFSDQQLKDFLVLENTKYLYPRAFAGLSYAQICEGLEQIGSGALDNLSYPYYTIPSTVNYIGNGAFEWAQIHTLIVKCTTPPVLKEDYGDFIYIYDDSTIFVPQGTKLLYLSATSWSNHGDIIYEIGEAATVTVNGVNYNYTIGETWEDLIGRHTELSGVEIMKTEYYNEVVTMDEPISPKIQYGISQEA